MKLPGYQRYNSIIESKMKKLLSQLFASSLIFGTIFLINSQPAYAAANFYLSPSKLTVPQGNTFSVSVRVSSAEAIDSVQANLSYPADKLDFLSISTSGGTFDITAEKSGGGGSVRIGVARVGAVSGDRLVATVSFRAKVSSGTANISFAAGTEAVAAGNPVGGGTSGGTYTLAAPPPPPPPPDTTAPKISDVKAAATTFKGATIEWKSDEASSSIVEYGLTTKYGLSAEGAGGTKEHKVSFTSDLLLPGLTYHFRVKSADAAGNLATSGDSTFKTKGCTVKVKVVDQNNKPIVGAKVTLASGVQTATTDKEGTVSFTDIEPGKQLVTVEYQEKIQSQPVEVKEPSEKEQTAGVATTQNFEVKVAGATNDYLARYSLVALIAILFGSLLGAAGMFWWKGRRNPAQANKIKSRT